MVQDGPAAIGDSGLVVLVPEADAIVGDLRQARDPAAVDADVPAHVTVLFPFIPRASLDAAARHALRELFAGVAPFAFRFATVGRFDDTTVYLSPEPAAAFTELTRRVHARWPDRPPYGGAFAEVVPHLTVGDRLPPGAAPALEEEVAERLRTRGPVVGRATAVTLMTADASGRFAVDSAYPLAGR